jgi:hypothetical protein
MWVKRSKSGEEVFWSSYNGNNYRFQLYFDSSDRLVVYDVDNGSDIIEVVTNRKFRDFNAWYHIYVAIKSSESTASDRCKIYVNGERETSFAVATYQSTSNDMALGTSSYVLNIGRYGGNTAFFSGLMSHSYYVDGSIIDVTQFGSIDITSGQWKINTSPTIASYGNQGHLILKDGNTVTDQSPNSNNFTVGGGTLTPTVDNPSNVFATLNPLGGRNGSGKGSYQNGNTTWISSSTDQDACNSTLAVNDGGQYYCEMKCVAKTGGYYNPGVFSAVQSAYNSANPSVFVRGDGVIYNNDSQTQSGLTSVSNGDIIGMAYDGSGATHTIQFYLNGSTYGSSENITNTPGYPLFFGDGTNSGSVVNEVNFNFGNGYFGTTAVSSNSGNGYSATGNLGIFQHQPPTNYTALCTKGLNL